MNAEAQFIESKSTLYLLKHIRLGHLELLIHRFQRQPTQFDYDERGWFLNVVGRY
ncbi:hypothetical protein [Solilutibacter oculi]|uniref:hypothetical protein n=1 Tax=Solilutibacter oculi TaxID=2698682 RepID=UPI0013A62F24|nr:hypothetical protein [Lysobacter oculi]